jgi:two-component system, sensor histidine kinase YesM
MLELGGCHLRLLKSSIARSLLGSFLIVLLPIVLVNLYLNLVNMDTVKNEVTTSYYKSILLLSNQLDNNLIKFESLAYALASDNDILAANQAPYGADTVWEYVRQIRQLQFFSSTSELNSVITVYLRNQQKAISSKDGLLSIGPIENSFLSRVDTIPRQWTYSETLDPKPKKVLSFIFGSGMETDNGVVVSVEIELYHFNQIIKNLNAKEGGTAFMFGPQAGDVFPSSSPSDLSLGNLQNKIIQLGKTSGQLNYSHQGKNYAVLYHKSSHTGLILGMTFPEEQMMDPIYRIQKWVILIVAVSVGLGLFFVFFSYKKLLKPILTLLEAMGKVRMGHLHTRIQQTPKNEFGTLYKQFNGMVGQIDSLINEIYIGRLNQQQAQLKLLQSQINPHFLYNCLNFIYQMSMGGNNDGAAKMSLYLGKYFRYATKSNIHFVTLKEELDNIESYMQIQNMRFSGKLKFHKDIPDNLLNVVIPRLTLQPIVENAFVHGIEKDDANENNIWIYADSDQEHITITVENDGKAIKPEELQKIQASLKTLNHEDYGYGLNNTHWRIVLKYGENSGIRLLPRESDGLKVQITIPFDSA